MNEKSKILLTIYLEEGYHSRVVGKNFCKKRFCKSVITSDGIIKCRVPQQRDYQYFSQSKIRVQTLSSGVVEYFQSKESRPIKKCQERFNWLKMTPHQRLMYNLSQYSEGKRFEFSFF